jgi:hypothetical protein
MGKGMGKGTERVKQRYRSACSFSGSTLTVLAARRNILPKPQRLQWPRLLI